MSAIITLTTDFGMGSPYVAQMKGVILSICRDVKLVDITHSIGPQNVREGAVVLDDATRRFPPDTIHVAVVDPGVGTARRIVYVEIGDQRYIAPDNGLLSRLARREPPRLVIVIENPAFWLPEPSATFHGRDIMAPVAAHLADGINPAKLGPQDGSLLILEAPQPQESSRGIAGEVLLIDSFGNLITNIDRESVAVLGNPTTLTIDCGDGQVRGVVPSYGAGLNGELVVLFDSQGRLEIAKVGGSAAKELQIQAGEPVIVSQS
jgi:S-adenosylmethionine hydrolase